MGCRMKFKAVIFDLDGTLLDSVEDLADSMNFVLRHFEFPEHDLNAYKFFVGNGMEVLVRKALPESHRDEKMVSQCFKTMKEEYSRRCVLKTRPYKGIPALLDGFAGRGLKMAILSNKPDAFTRKMVSFFFPCWHFDMALGARPDWPKKPDPQVALYVAERMGLPPRDFLYMGDTFIDMKTSTSAGMYPLGVLWGFRRTDELIAGGARMLLRAPEDLLAWI
jgi:phosphoglycolate phosphatase